MRLAMENYLNLHVIYVRMIEDNVQTDPGMLRPLRQFYTPKGLPHRREQLQFLAELFENYRSGKHVANVFIRGVTGTGKSTTVEMALATIPKRDYVLVRGTQAGTPTKVLQAITDSTYRTEYRLLAQAQDMFRFNPKIVIVDEIDKIARRKELFTHLNTVYKTTGVPIIIISNVLALLQSIPDDARGTLFFRNLNFEPYNANQLYDILMERVSALAPQLSAKVSDHTAQYICAKGAREGDGNARIVLEAVCECLTRGDFSTNIVDALFNEIANQDWVQFYNNFTPTQKRFLNILLEVNAKHEGQPFKAKALKKLLPELTSQRVSQLITEFEEQEIIETKMVNAGVGGRYRRIWFSSEEMVKRLSSMLEGQKNFSTGSEGEETQGRLS